MITTGSDGSATAENVQIGMGRVPIRQKIDLYFVNLGLGLNPYPLWRARLREIVALELKSDDQLAHMGLSRDEILPHVFRDLLTA